MNRLTLPLLVGVAIILGFLGTFGALDSSTAQDRDAERIAALETQVAWLVPNTMDLNGVALPPPVLAADIGWFTAGQSFTTENAFRLVCRIGELNSYYDLTCIRATFP